MTKSPDMTKRPNKAQKAKQDHAARARDKPELKSRDMSSAESARSKSSTSRGSSRPSRK